MSTAASESICRRMPAMQRCASYGSVESAHCLSEEKQSGIHIEESYRMLYILVSTIVIAEWITTLFYNYCDTVHLPLRLGITCVTVGRIIGAISSRHLNCLLSYARIIKITSFLSILSFLLLATNTSNKGIVLICIFAVGFSSGRFVFLLLLPHLVYFIILC